MCDAVCEYFQEEYLSVCYWRTSQMPVDLVDKYDPLKPFYEQYRIDFDQFKTLILALCPWSSGLHADILALRLFRVCGTQLPSCINYLIGLAYCSSSQTGVCSPIDGSSTPQNTKDTDGCSGLSKLLCFSWLSVF